MNARYLSRWLTILCVLCVTGLHAEPPPKLNSVELFAFGGVGIVGSTSPGEKTYREVLASPDAIKQFQATLRVGTPAAQLYALCGIHQLAPASFEEYAKPLRKLNPAVNVAAGCIVGRESAAGIITNIAAGRYDSAAKDAKSK